MHDEYFRISLLEDFDQYQLGVEYGGMAHKKYDVGKLKKVTSLSEFIVSYLDLSEA